MALTGCALVLIGLLYSLGGSSPELALHLAVVLGLAVALAVAINWWGWLLTKLLHSTIHGWILIIILGFFLIFRLVIQTGTVDAAAQRENLLGEKKKGEAATEEGEEPSASSRGTAEWLTTEAVRPTNQSCPAKEATNEETKRSETTDIAKDKRL